MGRNKAKNMPMLPHKDPTYWQVLTCQYVGMSRDTFIYFLDKFSESQCWCRFFGAQFWWTIFRTKILGPKFHNQFFGHNFLSQKNVNKYAKVQKHPTHQSHQKAFGHNRWIPWFELVPKLTDFEAQVVKIKWWHRQIMLRATTCLRRKTTDGLASPLLLLPPKDETTSKIHIIPTYCHIMMIIILWYDMISWYHDISPTYDHFTLLSSQHVSFAHSFVSPCYLPIAFELF